MGVEECVEKLVEELQEDCEKYIRLGRRYYSASYTLTILAVSASLLAGALAMWSDIKQEAIGAVALIPAFCVAVAHRLKLVDKGNWFYLTGDRLKALAREACVETSAGLDATKAKALVDKANAIYLSSGAEWAKDLSFLFEDSKPPKK